ncbi:MAG: DUF4835 family protein [Bacteroidales bacterium]|nr:DUF4835 family protein [Bacteroidales bacterium]
MIRKLIIFLIICSPAFARAQEFMCQVSVNSPQVEGSEKKVFQSLQTQLYEFVNNRKWTNYIYKPEERIECSIMITVTERVSSDQFKGKVNIVLKRPVYKTSYNSDLLNLVDKDFDFKYVEFEPLEYNDDAYTSNLTSMVAYYLYVMLGIDADSFSKLGGTLYYEKARAAVNAAQNSSDRGWKAFESLKNRYWLVENLLNNAYSPFRDGLYSYHRTGLDLMSENMDLGRSGVNDCLENLQKVNREKTGLYITQLFLDAKRDELINIYSQAAPMDKTKIVNMMKEIDPANSSKYQQIMTSSK